MFAMLTSLLFFIFCLFPSGIARQMTPAELEKQRELDDLQQRLHVAKQKLTATEEFWEKEKLEAAVKAKAEELHKLDPDNQPTVLTRDPRYLEDAADRPSMYLEPSKAAADPFDGPVWIQPGEDFRITTAEVVCLGIQNSDDFSVQNCDCKKIHIQKNQKSSKNS